MHPKPYNPQARKPFEPFEAAGRLAATSSGRVSMRNFKNIRVSRGSSFRVSASRFRFWGVIGFLVGVLLGVFWVSKSPRVFNLGFWGLRRGSSPLSAIQNSEDLPISGQYQSP